MIAYRHTAPAWWRDDGVRDGDEWWLDIETLACEIRSHHIYAEPGETIWWLRFKHEDGSEVSWVLPDEGWTRNIRTLALGGCRALTVHRHGRTELVPKSKLERCETDAEEVDAARIASPLKAPRLTPCNRFPDIRDCTLSDDDEYFLVQFENAYATADREFIGLMYDGVWKYFHQSVCLEALAGIRWRSLGARYPYEIAHDESKRWAKRRMAECLGRRP